MGINAPIFRQTYIAYIGYSWSYPCNIPTKDLPMSRCILTGKLVKRTTDAGRRALRAAVVDHGLTLCEVSLGDRLILAVSREQPAETIVFPVKCGENVGK